SSIGTALAIQRRREGGTNRDENQSHDRSRNSADRGRQRPRATCDSFLGNQARSRTTTLGGDCSWRNRAAERKGSYLLRKTIVQPMLRTDTRLARAGERG